jgi:type VI secretion system secreted protein VgrG
MALNQSSRLIRMTKGPLGPDEVVVTSLSGRESISRPFSFDIEFISTQLDLKPRDIIGKDLAIELDRRDRTAQPLPPRYLHGYVSRFGAGDVVYKDSGLHKYRHYRVEMVPWLWFLTQTARCYLFFPEKEEKSIFDVIQAVVDRAKSDLHVDPMSDLSGIEGLRSRMVKHCVQYRETDFNFVSRTMEKYGVFYYFRFEDGKHTLVLEMKKNYPLCEEAEVSYPRVSGAQPAGDHITQWEHDYEFVSGKWSHTDYNFETPAVSLIASVPRLPSVDVPQSDKYEIYDYPGGYAVKGEGEADARVRQEEREVPHNTVNGTSTCRTFTAGHKFELMTYPDEDVASEQGKSYLLTSVQHAASQSSDDTGDSGTSSYSNRFTCILDSVQFRPDRRTPQPLISGIQTAVVVGPPGSEIHEGKYGQVKVQFHWDREGKKDGKSSCWVRVSSPWAGKGWGSVATPRIGQEVVVEFLEGDPDQPLIIGNVYNEDNKPPHTGVVSGLKSNTHKGSGHNQMTMDDTAGKEKITIHGQYDMGTTVLHDQTNTVNNDFTETIKKNATISITEGNLSHDVVAGTATYHVMGALDETYDATQKTTVAESIDIVSTGGPIAVSSDSQHIYVNAATSIQLHVGESMIWMDAGGQINIKGINVAINGAATVTIKGGVVHSEAESEHQTKGAIVLSEGSATNTVKGGMVMLNP